MRQASCDRVHWKSMRVPASGIESPTDAPERVLYVTPVMPQSSGNGPAMCAAAVLAALVRLTGSGTSRAR